MARVRISRSAAKRAILAISKRQSVRAADASGSVVVSQVQARFVNGGDEEVSWPPLWASNDQAISKSIRKGTNKAERAALQEVREKEVARIERHIERTYERQKSGEMDAAKAKRSRIKARAKLADAKKIRDTESAKHYRRGGKPLRDTGEMAASINYRVEPTERGARLIIGTPVSYAGVHQNGAPKRKGLSYIPFNLKAARGYTDRLVYGRDYIILRGVSTPARPFVRWTRRNQMDVIDAISQRGR